MIDSEFDDFAKGKLGDHEVPVPADLWNRVADAQFDQFIGNKLKEKETPVPEGLWDKITDAQFDSFLGDKLTDNAAPVPAGLWDRINDHSFDVAVGDKLTDYLAPVPAGLWDKISDGQFDGFVRGKLYDYEAPVPAGLWKKIRPEEDDDHGGLVWFRGPARAAAIVALVIGLLGGGYWLLNTHNKNVDANTTHTGTNNTNDANTNAGSLPGKLNKDEHLNNDRSAQQPSPDEGNAASTTQPGNVQSNAPDESGLNSKSNFDLRSGGRIKNSKGENISANRNSVSGTGGSAFNGNSIDQKNQLAVNRGKNQRQGESVIPANSAGLLAPPANNDNFGFIEPYQQNHLSPGNTVPADINHVDGALNMLDKQAIAKHYGQFKSVIICPADKNRNTDWFLEAYTSPDFAFRSVTNNSASQTYLSRKDSSESMRVGYTAGIRLVKPITDNIIAKAGVQYTQMNQKYVYRTENEVKTITVVSTRTIIRAPGDTVIVRDTSVLQQIGFKNNTVINRFRSVDVPLTIGYQFGNDDLKIGVNAGVVINLSSWYQGVMLDSTLATVPIPKGGNALIYKNHVGLGIVGSVSLVKKLSDDLHIFAEPYFRYNLSNMTTSNSPYNQKFSLGGIAVGVRLNLNRQ